MHIVCPHCTTSYAIDPSTLGEAGRTVRCSRCKEVWLARVEDAVQVEVREPAMTAEAGPNAGLDEDPGWGDLGDGDPPIVDSPPIASEMQAFEAAEDPLPVLPPEPAPPALPRLSPEPIVPEREDPFPARSFARPRKTTRLQRLLAPAAKILRPVRPILTLPIATTAMAALALSLTIWRAEVVRLMPQTATFYKLVGLEVNLRGLSIKDVKVATETVDGKSVLVIEGAIFDEARKPVELPRLRFVVRDERGTEIYAWNALLEQTVLQPGEKAWFRSRLASPPAEARSIDVRFFSRRDIGAGGV